MILFARPKFPKDLYITLVGKLRAMDRNTPPTEYPQWVFVNKNTIPAGPIRQLPKTTVPL